MLELKIKGSSAAELVAQMEELLAAMRTTPVQIEAPKPKRKATKKVEAPAAETIDVITEEVAPPVEINLPAHGASGEEAPVGAKELVTPPIETPKVAAEAPKVDAPKAEPVQLATQEQKNMLKAAIVAAKLTLADGTKHTRATYSKAPAELDMVQMAETIKHFQGLASPAPAQEDEEWGL